jgi:biotin carboxylase
MTVSAVAENIGLPGITRASALLAADKLAMKDSFAAFGVPIPWYQPVFEPESVRQILNTRQSCLVIKPVDSRGARGVLKIDCKSDIDWAFSIAAENSPTGRVMVEAYLKGPQVSTESLVLDGKCFTPGFSDRNYEFLDRFAPNIIENGGDLPSFLSARQQLSIRQLVEDASNALGVTNGVIKGDIVLFQGKPHVIELAARLSGGYFCTHEIPLNTGVNFVEAAIKQCLGDSINTDDLIPKFQKGVAQRFMFPQPGQVVSIDIENWILKDPDIALFEIRVCVGDMVQPAFNHPARAGVVIATGVNREAAIQKAEAAVSAVRIITQ